MPFLEDNIGLKGCEFIRGSECKLSRTAFFAFKGDGLCPFEGCGRSTRIKDTLERKLKVFCMAGKLFNAVVSLKKRYCPHCKKYFRESLPGVLPRARVTETFKSEVFLMHEAGASVSTTSKRFQVSASSVDRWVSLKLVGRLKETLQQREYCPEVIGIDEHFFSKKKGFATTIVNLKKRRIFDVKLGRSEKSMEGYFQKLKGKEKVTTVLMDLSETYRSIATKHFPNAKIIADRFHVVRVVFQAFQQVWHALEPGAKWKRGLGNLFRMHSWNLNEDKKIKLSMYLESKPAIGELYRLRNEINNLLVKKSQRGFQVEKNVKEYFKFIQILEDSNLSPLKTLATTLKSWSAEIGRMWQSNYSNGVVEGFHNKMELISRRAFGYRNFENYRRRVLAMLGWDGLESKRTLSGNRTRPRKR